MLSDIKYERRINEDNLIRKTRFLSSSNLSIKNDNIPPNQEKNSVERNLLNFTAEKFEIQPDNLNKNPYLRTKIEIGKDSNNKERSNSVTKKGRNSLSSSSRTLRRILGQEPAEYDSVDGFGK